MVCIQKSVELLVLPLAEEKFYLKLFIFLHTTLWVVWRKNPWFSAGAIHHRSPSKPAIWNLKKLMQEMYWDRTEIEGPHLYRHTASTAKPQSLQYQQTETTTHRKTAFTLAIVPPKNAAPVRARKKHFDHVMYCLQSASVREASSSARYVMREKTYNTACVRMCTARNHVLKLLTRESQTA